MKGIAIIINKKAKNAHLGVTYLEALQQAVITYQLYESEPEQLASLIQKCILEHALLLIGGGDGTIRTAAHYCANTSTILGVLPLGTLNHFAKELCLPTTVDEMLDAIKQQQTNIIDLAEVNGLIFINNSSIGLYPKFAKKRDFYSQYYNKWLSYIPSFINSLRSHKAFTATIKSKKLNFSLRTSFLMISNNVYSYEFPATIKRDNFNKASLGLYYFKYGKIRLIKLIKTLFNNKNNFAIKQSEHPIEIHFAKKEKVTISLDGDTFNVDTPLYYQSLPKSLTLLVKSLCV